jgi:DNA-binding response OmpR family regulator
MIKILILEDEKGTCTHIERFLKYRGYKTFAATNGKEALAIIKKESPQILFLDIMMEGINGLEVLEKAKKENPKVRAIMITAIDDVGTRQQARNLGADEYITKPFSYDILEKVLIRLVNEVIKTEEDKK